MTFEQLQSEGYIKVLAQLFNRGLSAHQLLRRSGVPIERLPPFEMAPMAYWTEVFREAYNGLVDDPTVIVWKALDDYQHNDTLRQITRKPRPRALGGRDPVRILYVAANPLDTIHLDQQGEFRAIRKCLQAPGAAGLIHLDSAWATQPEELLSILHEYQPTVIHFAVHGQSDGSLVFDDGNGRSSVLDPMTFANVFRALNRAAPRTTSVVVLNACYSRQAAEAIRPTVDVVVGTTDRISDAAALAFTRGFYTRLVEALAGNDPVPLAARSAIGAGRDRVCALPPSPNKANPDPNSPDNIIEPPDPNAPA